MTKDKDDKSLSKKKEIKISLGSVAGWIFGIVFLLEGMALLLNCFPHGLASGALFLGASGLLLQPIRAFAYRMTNISFSGGARLIIVLVLIMLAAHLAPHDGFSLMIRFLPSGYQFFFAPIEGVNI